MKSAKCKMKKFENNARHAWEIEGIQGGQREK
jgi:hypothetical protein